MVQIGVVHCTGYMRRRLSSEVIRANVRCLLERIVQVGEGAGQVGKKEGERGWSWSEKGGVGKPSCW